MLLAMPAVPRQTSAGLPCRLSCMRPMKYVALGRRRAYRERKLLFPISEQRVEKGRISNRQKRDRRGFV